MSIEKLDSYLKSFFQREKKILFKNYPGITLYRLKQEIIWQAAFTGMSAEELFNSPYIFHKTHPLSIFFEKLLEGVPLEYITGHAYFHRSVFKVTKDVLIPRSETEILVELAQEEIKKKYKNKRCQIADIGTGSGAIAISLLMQDCVALDLIASDLSKAALDVARENFFLHEYSISPIHQAIFIESDRLEKVPGGLDLIIANPPYIKKKENWDEVHEQVKKFEPHLALFLDDFDYTNWFKHFFESIYEKLNMNGVSFIEGHEKYLEDLANLARKIGFRDVVVIQDYTQRNRFLKLHK